MCVRVRGRGEELLMGCAWTENKHKEALDVDDDISSGELER